MKEDFEPKIKRHFELPKSETLKEVLRRFSLTEKIIFSILFILLSISSFSFILKLNDYLTVEKPVSGGSIAEGIIGSPRFINPLFATTDADKDLSILVYSGLMRANSSGELIPDLAENYDISEDGLVYTFTLKNNLKFHDNTPLTTNDIEFTILKAQDSALKSPKRANWDSVAVEVVNEREIKFYLKQPYAPFLENATLGILPKHIWKDASSEEFPLSVYNIEPIGSGPYKVSSIKKDSIGIPTRYTLKPFKDFALGKPYINSVTLSFYPNQRELFDAYERGDIDAINSLSPDKLSIVDEKTSAIYKSTLPRIFAVFFNQNKAPVFTNAEVRKALDLALDKNLLVKEILEDYGKISNGPIPEVIRESNPKTKGATSTSQMDPKSILEKTGWKKNDVGVYAKKTKTDNYSLEFSISTSNTPELKEAASMIETMWESLGANVEIKVFETGDLNQNVIRPREYDALLFGLVVGRDLDLFAFWHSSQRNDPGLNVALYTNSIADKLLSEARENPNRKERLMLYQNFEEEIRKDIPAVFLYSPDFIYVTSNELKGVELGSITSPSERFLSVYKWYLNTEKIWSFFE